MYSIVVYVSEYWCQNSAPIDMTCMYKYLILLIILFVGDEAQES